MGDKYMDKKINYDYILQGQVTIPSQLLISYKDYGLDETDLVIIIQIHRFLQEGKDFPTLTEISQPLSIEEQDCALILRKLIQKNLLIIQSKVNENHQLSESYSLEPLWQRIFTPDQEESVKEEDNIGSLFILFEQEFGRPLSPFEIEMVNSWLDADKCSPALIKAALRESVLMSKLNFKYIDRILHEWKRKGIHTVDQAREETKNFRKPKQEKQIEGEEKRKDPSFYYNWLEDDE